MNEEEIPNEKLATVAWLTQLSPREMWQFLLIIWVATVSVAIAHICGWLVAFGLASPFAQAGDLASIQKNIKISATINLTRELRDDYNTLCGKVDDALRVRIAAEIDLLQQDFLDLTGHYYPPQPCQRS